MKKEFEGLENFVVSTTKTEVFHKMKMRETFAQMQKIYDDLQDLEKADLYDLKTSEENGSFS